MTFNGKWIIKGLFLYCNEDNKNKKIDIVKKDITYTKDIIVNVLDINSMIEKALNIINNKLPEYLKENKILQLIPMRKLTYAYNDNNIFEICYYHNII